MKKYEISLPNNKVIKYRVTKETSDWILIESIIDKETLTFLNNFATVTEVAEVTEVAPSVAPSVNPSVIPSEPTVEEVKAEEKKNLQAEQTVASFSDAQKAAMKNIKDQMKLKTNDELDPFISEWSMRQGKSWHYLNASNIDDFVQHMDKNYLS